LSATLCVADDCRVSHCNECDAHPRDCGHSAGRYLAPITYELAEAGFVVPEHERERCANPVKGAHVRPPGFEPGAIPLELNALVAELEEALYLDANLKRSLRALYARHPLRATRIAQSVIQSARSGTLSNPGGLLASYLRDELATEPFVSS
jgi:hypothetical protein